MVKISFSLAIANGDLVQDGSQMRIIYGSNKLKQDLTLWMTERYGIDRFHPAMGSELQSYIGSVINFSTQSMVRSEVNRILDNYQRVQYLGLRSAPTRYSLSELLYSVNSVNVGVGFDAVSVGINVSNALQQPTSINLQQGA